MQDLFDRTAAVGRTHRWDREAVGSDIGLAGETAAMDLVTDTGH